MSSRKYRKQWENYVENPLHPRQSDINNIMLLGRVATQPRLLVCPENAGIETEKRYVLKEQLSSQRIKAFFDTIGGWYVEFDLAVTQPFTISNDNDKVNANNMNLNDQGDLYEDEAVDVVDFTKPISRHHQSIIMERHPIRCFTPVTQKPWIPELGEEVFLHGSINERIVVRNESSQAVYTRDRTKSMFQWDITHRSQDLEAINKGERRPPGWRGTALSTEKWIQTCMTFFLLVLRVILSL